MVDVKPSVKSGDKPADAEQDKPAEHKSEDVWYVVAFAGGNVTTYGEYDNKRDAEETASVLGAVVLPSTRKVVEE